MIRILPALLLAFALAAPAPAQEDKPKQDPPRKDDAQEELARRSKDMQAKMTEIRTLDFKKDVKLGVYTKKELVDFLKAEITKEMPQEKIDRIQKAYSHFGLIPRDFNLLEATLTLLGESIAGFYHPKTKEMRLIRPGEGGEIPGEKELEMMFKVKLEDVTLVHELCHAAQDQHFELTTLPMDEEANDDLVAAIKGLVEGDASIVGWKYCFKKQFDMFIGPFNDQYKTGMAQGKAAELPAYMRKSLSFPYGYGTDFVLAVWRNAEDDWSAVSKMFEDPPSSTEQILHPKKYYQARDNPTLLTIDTKALGGDWKEIYTNVHGEFGTRLLLAEFKAQKTRDIEKACAGWDGDRFHTFERDGKVLTVWMTTWDSEEDAVEFFEAYGRLIEAKYEGAAREASDQKLAFDAKDKGGRVLIERRGSDVLVFDGADEAALGKANAVWTSAKKAELKKVERLKLLWQCEKHATERSSKAGKCDVCGGELKKREDK